MRCEDASYRDCPIGSNTRTRVARDLRHLFHTMSVKISAERLQNSLFELARMLEEHSVPYAIAGAFAVAVHGHVRATEDIDALIAAADASSADRALIELGYVAVYRDPRSATYVRQPLAELPGLEERCDLLFSSKPLGLESIQSALENPVSWHGRPLPVVPVDVLILMKIIAIVADPQRPNDRADARALLLLHRDQIEMNALRLRARTIGNEIALELERVLDEARVAESAPRYGGWAGEL